MKLTDTQRWWLGLVIVVVVAISIAYITNSNVIRNFGGTNAKLDENNAKLDENNAKLDENNAKLDVISTKIDSSSERTIAAVEKNTEAIATSSEKTIAAVNESSRAIVDAILSTSDTSDQKNDSTSESSDYIAKNTPGSSIFPVVESDNREVYLNLAGAIQESGLVPNSEVLSPIVLISLNDSIKQEDLARIWSISNVPIDKVSFVTYEQNSAEHVLFWNILAPSIVPSHLEGVPLTISYAITN